MSEPLGAAVTESFPSAVGLHELIGADRVSGSASAPSATPPAAAAPTETPAAPREPEVPAVEFSPKLFLNGLRLADKMASRLLKVEPETPEMMEEIAGAIAPLVQYYAGTKSTVGALWGNLFLALLAVGYAKYEKVQARAPAEPKEPDGGGG